LIEHLHKRAKMKGREVLERLEELIREGEKRGTHTELPRGVAEIEWEGRRNAAPVEVKKMYAEEDGGETHICNGCCWRRGGRVDDDLLPLQ